MERTIRYVGGAHAQDVYQHSDDITSQYLAADNILY